jgi:oligopeptide/dipeptide ABC transporter ATP-binding protein
MTLLRVSDLSVVYRTNQGTACAVTDVSFEVEEGEFFGLIGESGSGKTTVARAIFQLLPSSARVTGGEITYKGKDLLRLDASDMRRLRWRELSNVPQSAMNSLDPVYRLRDQMVEPALMHDAMSKQEALERARAMFQLVGIDPKRLDDYPHQFSGGMKQRAIIAMALMLDPSLILADEPTTGLDVVVQDQIFRELSKIVRELRKSVFLITHDVSLIAENADHVAVMYGGRIMECGSAAQLFASPFHPYTMGLENAYPNLRGEKPLVSIPGFPPSLLRPPEGCPFSSRCPFATPVCYETLPPLVEVEPGHYSLCHYPDKTDEFRVRAKDPETWHGR